MDTTLFEINDTKLTAGVGNNDAILANLTEFLE